MKDAHAQLMAWFERLVGLPPLERQSVLAQCDPVLRLRLQRLLAADAGEIDPLAEAISSNVRSLVEKPDTGTRLGAYRVLRELGAGGMGTVLLAERADGHFSQQVAIKLIRGFPTEEGQRRLRQERQILAQLDHPNIAHLLDGGEAQDGQPYVVMEYIEGLPLLDHVARHQLGIRDRLALFDRIAAAVQHAHERLVIHRDLKPGNVMVRADGEPKLLDFGVAKLVDVGLLADASQTSTRVWTPGYASPEQRSGGVITTASDVYALGVLLREMLSGERAPGHRAGLPMGFPAVSLDADLRGILAKATAESPEARYPTVDALRADLGCWLRGRPVHAARDSALYRMRKFIGRHRLGVMMATLALAGLSAFVWRLDQERARATTAEAHATVALQAAERDAATARAALDFLTDAFQAAAPDHVMSATVSVRDLLDQARTQLDKRVASDQAMQAPIRRLLGHLYHGLGEPHIAIELFAAGLQDVVAVSDSEGLSLARDYATYSDALGAVERGEDALAMAEHSAALQRLHAPDDIAQELAARSQLGYGHYRNHDYDQAEQHWRQVLELGADDATVPSETVANAYQVLGGMLAFLGRAAEAIELADAGLRFVDRHFPAEAPIRVNLLRTRGEALGMVGELQEAEATLRSAIALQEKTTGLHGWRLSVLYNALGIVLNEMGRYRESLAAFEHSVALAREVGGAPVGDAIALTNIASVRESAGDYVGALADFEIALAALDRERPDPDQRDRRIMERSYARCLGLAGQHERARQRLDHLRERALELDGADSFEFAMVTWQRAVLARWMQEPAAGLGWLAEAEQHFSGLLPPTHPVFAHARRLEAAFIAQQGHPQRAEVIQRVALAALEATAVLPVDVAIAEAELAGYQRKPAQREEARERLRRALPVLRAVLLPEEISRVQAEQLAATLGVAVD